jgi:integrase
MARRLKRLTARTVATMTKPGRHADGGNLYLTISKTGAGASPKKADQEAAAARKTFGQCADELIKSKRREWRSEVHAAQWRTTIDDYCGPILDKPVDTIDTAAVLSVLQPVWARIPETASRLRGRIEAVLDFAKAQGLRSGENPAAWRGHLALILPKRQKLSHGHHAAMPYAEVPAFIGKLREVESIPARALEFLILTAGRVGEVLGTRWSEIDIALRIWVIPGNRMKAGRFLCQLVPWRSWNAWPKSGPANLIFPGQRRRRPLSNPSLARLCPAMVTPHGFRSAFRDWCGEETSFPRELAEAPLAHVSGDATERAYRRGNALEKRRRLMEAWSNYCEPVAAGKVVPIRVAQ